MKRRVDVQDLSIGMYVAELDRPWLGSPFLFQGFTIETEDDIAKLQDYCAYVMVEVEDGEAGDGGTDDSSGTGRAATGSADQTSGAVVSMQSFRREVPRAARARHRTTSHVSKVLDDARLGRSIDAQDTRETVSELIDTISVNANASIWLTALKRVHDETADHCLNVCVLALAFGRHLGFESARLESLGVGALFHDVGKARLPAEILRKQDDELDEAERQRLRQHPVDGYNVMRLTREVPADALSVVRSHHERLDGQGYPDGLSGESVPELARIVAIVDRYDRLTSLRAGGRAEPPHVALKHLREEAAGAWGTELVNQFLQCIGIYPVGSMVQLSSGAVGVVVSSDRNNRLQPVVMMLIDENGRRYQRRPTISLAARARQADREPLTITRAMDPAALGIDLSALVEDELGG